MALVELLTLLSERYNMTAQDWAALAVAVMTIVAGFATLVRWLVKHYLYELRPNGGGSVKDQVNRLEERVDQIYVLLCEREQ
jgi:H+/Cl- antiporter ClcA